MQNYQMMVDFLVSPTHWSSRKFEIGESLGQSSVSTERQTTTENKIKILINWLIAFVLDTEDASANCRSLYKISSK